jgi:hypothetical protein
MRHRLPLNSRASGRDESALVIALFDTEGRLLRGSDSYSTLLENRALTDDLLALPRSLTLRAACGYDPATTGPLTARTISVGDKDVVLRGRFVESRADAGIAVALTLSAAPGESKQHQSEAPMERPLGFRWTRPRPQPAVLPLPRLRVPIKVGR